MLRNKRKLFCNNSNSGGPEKLRVNVLSRLECNKDTISSRTFEGVEHVVISGAKHMIGDSVMNGILYPASEMEVLRQQLNEHDSFVPAPAEHPTANGDFISAADPRSLIQHGIGAFHFNFRIEMNRLLSDTAINPRVAFNTDRGREVMDRINQMRPVDMSTGFFLVKQNGQGTARDGNEFNAIASNLDLDHSALLIESPGAKTSDEGVGLFANNAAGERMPCDTVTLEDNASRPGTFPIAESDPEWDSPSAVMRWREFTGATEAPNAQYAQGFMFFDADNADNFTAYKLPFVDIINGEPMAVPAALRNIAARLEQTDGPTDEEREAISARVSSMLEKFRESQNNTDEGMISRIVNALKGVFIEKMDYTNPIHVNHKDTDPMRDKMLAALNAAKVKTEGLDDDALFQAYNELLTKEPEVPDVTAAVNAAIAPLITEVEGLKTQLTANSDTELASLADVVVNSGQYPGMDLETVKGLPVEKVKELAANCGVAYQANAGQPGGAATEKCEMPD